MKTKEELNAIKAEVEELNKKLSQLTEDELSTIAGGLHNMPEKHEDEKYVLLQTYKKDIGSDKNAKVIF